MFDSLAHYTISSYLYGYVPHANLALLCSSTLIGLSGAFQMSMLPQALLKVPGWHPSLEGVCGYCPEMKDFFGGCPRGSRNPKLNLLLSRQSMCPRSAVFRSSPSIMYSSTRNDRQMLILGPEMAGFFPCETRLPSKSKQTGLNAIRMFGDFMGYLKDCML